ncbi:Tigger transposable element-derived protein 2 [Holothuria leucospilota]|uniref:Tigger transposable element-derived protein 2 n=1 Tax=Holothuria leucospilota TaxID=206669 RepID=A0A9Q1BGM3_HOLLE|nr:Tigger transposable element-derived protein 2 [Holothuria leucospilota]
MKLSACGYPLSRREVITLATESAELLGTRAANGNQLSKGWFERFMRRWPQLRLAKAQKLSLKRAKATSKETVESYFKELEKIFVKYELTDKPHLIYNVDETGFQTEHEPTKVVGVRNQRLNSITSERGAITTVLACRNACGTALPPYFVFKGRRDDPRLMNGSIPGAKYTMSDSGWSNGAIFKLFLEEHFIPLLPQRQKDEHALLMYDGHASHISLPLIELAKEHKIILFVLPPHTSHALQPLDVGTFRPVKCRYSYECQKEMRK